MLNLAVSTSTKYLCIVIFEGNKILQKYNRLQDRAHAQFLLPEIGRLLKKTKHNLSDMDCLAVDIGPGSFTGIRIGIATVKGLAHATKLPCAGVPSLDLIAGSFSGAENPVAVIIDAKRNQVYGAFYEQVSSRIKRKGKYFLGSVEDFLENIKTRKEIIFTGDALSIYGELVKKYFRGKVTFADEKSWYPQPKSFPAVAKTIIQQKNFIKPSKLSPIYLYATTCTVQSRRKKKDKGKK